MELSVEESMSASDPSTAAATEEARALARAWAGPTVVAEAPSPE